MQVTVDQEPTTGHFVHLTTQLRLIFSKLTLLQVHYENITTLCPTKVTACNITMDIPSTQVGWEALEECLRCLRRGRYQLFHTWDHARNKTFNLQPWTKI